MASGQNDEKINTRRVGTTDRSRFPNDSPARATPFRPSNPYTTPPRSGASTQRYPYPQPNESPLVSDADIVPPEMAGTSDDSSFKSWLSSGIMDVLGTAAGVTLSTTGKLVAPPLHITKTVLLPGVLALLVDTLDSITPRYVQDWFRILSSSAYHLMVVLGNTEKGKVFSGQLYIVVQDMLQALSAPESRQVLVDGVATSVKFAEALHTPEMEAWLEQLSILSIRLLDAASSGKSKQFVQDTKDLAWKGIEMATDPATTLALAEVTAHLCHALYDTQQSLQNPTPRTHRNAQNRAVYFQPYQMADFPEQVTMEEVILSCLGVPNEDEDKTEEGAEIFADNGVNVRSRVTWEDGAVLSGDTPGCRDWKERREQVDVDLLRDRILREKAGVPRTSKPIKSSMKSPERSSDYKREEKKGVSHLIHDSTRRPDKRLSQPEDDMEDIAWSRVPGRQRLRASETGRRLEIDSKSSALTQFYQKLDELLEKNRTRHDQLSGVETKTLVNDSPADRHADSSSLQRGHTAVMKKLKPAQKKWSRASTIQPPADSNGFNRLPRKFQILILVIAVSCTLMFFSFTGFAFYGMYSLARNLSGPISIPLGRSKSKSSPSDNEVVIRIVREVVHVTESDFVMGQPPEAMTQAELDQIAEQVASALKTE